MSVVISDEVLQMAHMSASEMKRELAIWLFQQDKLTLAQASKLAEMNRLQFQFLLASRQIPPHYDVQDFEADLQTLREMDRHP